MQSDGRIRTSYVDWISLVLVIIGAVNWGLVGVGQFMNVNLNLVALVFGSVPALESLIYVVVGLAGLYELYFAYQLYGARSAPPATKRETGE